MTIHSRCYIFSFSTLRNGRFKLSTISKSWRHPGNYFLYFRIYLIFNLFLEKKIEKVKISTKLQFLPDFQKLLTKMFGRPRGLKKVKKKLRGSKAVKKCPKSKILCNLIPNLEFWAFFANFGHSQLFFGSPWSYENLVP